MPFFSQKNLFPSHYVWQWFLRRLIYNKNGWERDKARQSKKSRFLVLTFFCRCNLTASASSWCFYYAVIPYGKTILKCFFLTSTQPELSTTKAMKLFSRLFLPLSLWYSLADISSYGYWRCQFSGAAGLNPSYQSGHGSAEACGGAAPTVGDAARLLLCPSGEGIVSNNWNKSAGVKTIKSLMNGDVNECGVSYRKAGRFWVCAHFWWTSVFKKVFSNFIQTIDKCFFLDQLLIGGEYISICITIADWEVIYSVHVWLFILAILHNNSNHKIVKV